MGIFSKSKNTMLKFFTFSEKQTTKQNKNKNKSKQNKNKQTNYRSPYIGRLFAILTIFRLARQSVQKQMKNLISIVQDDSAFFYICYEYFFFSLH